MKQLHEKLVSKKGWYHFWHQQPGHKIAHWALFLFVAGFFTLAIYARINNIGFLGQIKGLFTFASNTIVVPTSGNPVANGTAFQQALDTVQCGQVIVLQAGATYATGDGSNEHASPFMLRNKSCSASMPITIQSSNVDALPEGTRVEPRNAPAMAKLVTASTRPALEFEDSSGFYNLAGLEVTNIGGTVFSQFLIYMGQRSSGPHPDVHHQPHDIVLDRMWLHEVTNDTTTPHSANTTARGGISMNATNVTIKDSRIAGFRTLCTGNTCRAEASYGILLCNANYNVNVKNNYIEAWFTAIFLGGCGGQTDNTATLTNPTYNPSTHTGSATFSATPNLNVGDLVALKTTGGRTPTTNGAQPGVPTAYQVVKVTAISGRNVSYISWGAYDGALTSGNPLLQVPDAPGLAMWDGYVNENITFNQNTLAHDYESTEYIWTHSGGCPTITQPYPANCYGNGPKGIFEIKMGRNVTFDGNIFTGWGGGNTVTTRNQGGQGTNGGFPWSTIENLRITNNYWTRNPNWPFGGFIGGPSLQDNEFTTGHGRNIYITNNLVDNGYDYFRGYLGAFSSADNVTFAHNTISGIDYSCGNGQSLCGGTMINGDWSNQNFVFKDNILPKHEYSMNCQKPGSGDIYGCWPGMVMTNNVIIGPKVDYRQYCTPTGAGTPFPAGNFCINTKAEVGWANPVHGDYSLADSSVFKGRASDGTDPGVNMSQLLAALGGQSLPEPFPVSTPNKSHLFLSPTLVSFNAVSGAAAPSAKNVTLNNTGTVTSNWNAAGDQAWCHVSETSGTLAPNAPVSLTITVDTPSNVGNFSCSVSITDVEADNSPQTIAVSYVVTSTAPPGPTPTGEHTLSGKTFTVEGQPFHNTIIVLSDSNGTKIDEMQEQGQDNSYSFSVPAGGDYKLAVQQAEYAFDPVEIVINDLCKDLTGLDFILGNPNYFETGPQRVVNCDVPPAPQPDPSPDPGPAPEPSPVPDPNPEPQPIPDPTGPPPVIISVSVAEKNATSAKIRWATNEQTSAVVNYGTVKANLNLQRIDDTIRENHSVILPTLDPKTTYYYQIVVSNENGTTHSVIGSFRTKTQ